VGAPALVTTRPLEPGEGGCPAGGVSFSYGTDDNGNGTLDDAEIDGTESICNGADLTADDVFKLQLLHFADIDGAGGIDDVRNFSALVDGFRSQYPENTLLVSSGDNLIPGPEFFGAEDDSMAEVLGVPGPGRAHIAWLNAMGLQASALGNHDLDASPEDLAELIATEGQWPGAEFPYLAANVDFSESALADQVVEDGQLVQSNTVSGSATVQVGDQTIGLVGASVPSLPSITNTGELTINPVEFNAELDADRDALAAAIQPAIDALTDQGINKIVLLAHMQQIAIEQALATRLEGVDVIVAGGSNTILADSTDRLREGDTAADTYPLEFTSAADEPVLVVNTDGDYTYLGRLVVEFDQNGVIDTESIDPVVSGAYASDVVPAQPFSPLDGVVDVADALAAVLEAKDGNILGRTAVYLDGRRGEVRSEETNMGNLTADANLWLAQRVDNSVQIALKNGGGIRNDIGQAIQPPGTNDPEAVEFLPPAANPAIGKPEGGISQLDLEISLRFNNGLTLLTVTAAELADIIEHMVGNVEGVDGRFPQVAGLRFSYDPEAQSRDAAIGALGQPVNQNQADLNIVGDRLQELAVVDDSGAVIDQVVEGGVVVEDPNRTFRLVILDFLALCVPDGGFCGDDLPLNGLTDPNRVDLGALDPETTDVDPGQSDFAPHGSEQDALAEYLQQFFAEVPFDRDETDPVDDLRIQDLDVRDDEVMALPSGPVTLEVLGEFTDNAVYDEGAAEIVTYDAGTQNLFVINADAGTIDVLDLADPTNPTLTGTIDGTAIDAADADFERGDFNSIAVQNGIIAVAVAADNEQANGRVAFYDASTLGFSGLVEVGPLPDMVTFTPDGNKVLSANEGEPNEDYTVDPEGSVSIVDISGGIGSATVTTAGFGGVAIPDGVRIFGPGASAAQDLEPEYIAVSADSSTAFVALQENNALGVLDLTTDSIAAVLALGVKDHSLAGNGFDADNDGEINIRRHETLGFYMPDSIVTYGMGTPYLVTANEGDTRDYDGFSEEEDLGDLPVFAGDPELEGLLSTSAAGDFDGDGLDDQLSIGARSFSVWDGSTGALLSDSGDDFERITAHLDRFGATGFALSESFNFNDDNDESERDGRSDNKGPEPEGVVTGMIDGRTYAFVGLERVGGVMVYDVSNPRFPVFSHYFNNRDFDVSVDDIDDGDLPADAAGDLGPEGLAFIPAEESPNGNPLLAVGNEVSGTTTIYQINVE